MLLALLVNIHTLLAQQPEQAGAAEENQLENFVNQTASVPENDEQWQQLSALTRRRLQLNTADAAALQSLGLLTPLQISSFLAYRQKLGKLLSIYELQAVPGFELPLIRRILPYVQVGNDLEPHYGLRDYLRKGEHALLLRYSRQPEAARGYMRTDSTPPHYLGDAGKLLLRYRYHFTRYCSWGVVMEKDAGEELFRGTQRKGFDFYSAHCFIRNYKKIKALALGDFTVNMGQGLLNWQSLALGKGPAVMQVKREGALLRPYASAGEFNFFRGAGATLAWGAWEVTGFVSLRRLDASAAGADSLLEGRYITALASSGYHRSLQEVDKRGQVRQFSTGASLVYNRHMLRIVVNVIQHRFSIPLQQEVAPYSQFAFRGNHLQGASIDYAAGWRNLHFFGEAAVSGNGKPALIHGILASLARRVDVALVYRYYHRAYQSLYSNAFGEYYRPVNENGLYSALSLRLGSRLRLDAYADVFRFPWLQYRAAAPSNGQEYLLACTYMPDKHTELFIRYSYQQRHQNANRGGAAIPPLVPVLKQSWRCQLSLQPAAGLTLKTRLEVNRYTKNEGPAAENATHPSLPDIKENATPQQGWMLFLDFGYRPAKSALQAGGRIARFATGGTDSRIYTVETGMQYDYAMSQLYGEGWQYQLQLKWNITRSFTCWLRFRQVTYTGADMTGTGWEQVKGNRKSLLQLQLQQLF